MLHRQPISASRVEPWIGREMAGEDAEHRRLTWDGEIPHPSEILRTRSERRHRVGELYRHMDRTDADLWAIQLKRDDAVLALPRRIEPADGSPLAAQAVELCRYVIEELITDLETPLRHLCRHAGHGVAIAEPIYERLARGPYAGAILPVDLIDRPMWRFGWRRATSASPALLHLRRGGRQLELAPPGKFIVARWGSKDSPWGDPLHDAVYWFWYLKRHGMKFWSVFVEKWAQPTVEVKYPRARHFTEGTQSGNAGQDRQAEALRLGRSYQSEQAVALPEDLEVSLREAVRSGSASYGDFISTCTRAMALIFLGEINTSGLRPGVGAFASDQVSNDIRGEKVRLLANELAGVLREQLLRPIVEINLGPAAPIPRFVIDTLEAEDRALRQRGVAAVRAAGEPVPRWYFYSTHQVPPPAEGDPVVEGVTPGTPVYPPGGGGFGAPAFSRRGGVRLAADDQGDDPEQAQADLDVAAASLRDLELGYWRDHQALALEAIERDAPLQTLIAEIDPRRRADLLLTAQIHAVGLAAAQLSEAGLLTARRPRRVLLADGGYQQATSPPTAIDWWTSVGSVARSVFEGFDDLNRRLAFSVAGRDEVSILQAVHQVLEQAQAAGWGRAQTREAIAEVYRRHGLEPTSPWHSDLVYANNTRQAQGAVRHQQTVGSPAARRLTPYVRWYTLGDHRVRPRHGVLHEMAFGVDHPIWKTWWYPAGHNCRCYAAAVSRAEAQRLGYQGDEPTGPWPTDPEAGGRVLPDPGFRSAPGSQIDQLASDFEVEADGAAQLAPETPGGEDLASAVLALMRLLGFGGGE